MKPASTHILLNIKKILIFLAGFLFASFTVFAGTYSSSAVSMTNVTTQYLSGSDANKAILRLSITAAAGGGSCGVDSVCFVMQNTANADVSNAKLYYTAGTATFNTTTQVSTTVTSPTGTIIFDNIGTTGITNTTVYYWLAFTIIASPTGCNTVDAYVPTNGLRITGTGSGEKTPTTPDPTGAVPIKGTPCFFIGSGTSLNTTGTDNTPFGNYFEGRKEQYLITASELTTAGVGSERSISRLAFNVDNIGTCNGLNNFVIYMKNTSSTSLSTTWETGLTQVYSLSSYQPVVSWNEITFDNSFLWNGTSNVLIEVCFNDEGIETFTQNPTTYYNASGATTTHYYRADNDVDLCTNPGAGSTTTNRPNIKLRIAATSGNMVYSSCTIKQGLTTNVTKSSTSNRVLDIEVVTTNPANAISATTFSFNTTGTTAPSTDITNGKLFYTGTTATFATTTQAGSTVAAPNGTFTINAATTLSEGTNYFWMTYDVPAGATTANVIDAQCTLINVGGTDRTPTATNPSGTRTIEGAMTYSSCTVIQEDDFAGVDVLNQAVIRIDIVTTGTTSAISATSFTLYTAGTTNTADINDVSIDLYYTGTTNVFSTTTLFGTATDPNNNTTSFNITGTQTLSEGTNYFWMAYDVPSAATVDNVIDGKCTSITVASVARTPTTQDPAGSRTIVKSWGGATATWGTSSNWAPSGVPTSTTNVFIASGRANNPSVAVTAAFAYCNNLTIQSGATLTINSDATTTLFIYGNLINDGTLTHHGTTYMYLRGASKTIHGTFTGDNGGGLFIETSSYSYTLDGNMQVGQFRVDGTMSLSSYTLTIDDAVDAFTLSAGATLNLNTGNLNLADITPTFSGTLNENTGTVYYYDSPTSIVAETYYNLKVGTYSAVDMHLNLNAITISNNLDFTAVTSGGTAHLDANLTVSGALTIPSGTELQLTYGGVSRTLTVTGNYTNGGTITCGTTSAMNCVANFTNNGTFTPSTGTVTFNGSAAQTLSGSTAPTFYNLTINNTSSTGITLSSAATVNNTLTLTDGFLYTDGTNLLTLGVDAPAISGATSASYIIGPVAKIKNTTAEFVFQTGKGSRYVRIGITPASTAQATYQAEHFNAAYSNTSTMGAGMNHIGVLQYWVMDRTVGSTNAQVRLYWDANSNSGTVDNLTDLRVSRWDGSAWSDAGQASTTGTTTDGTILSNSVSSFSPFNLGSSSANNPLPITLVKFTATPEGKVVKLNWTTASEINNDYFTIERTRDNSSFDIVTTADGAGNSTSSLSYSATDEKPLSGTSYYRLKQTDFDGNFTYSQLVAVTFAPTKFELISIKPNPINDLTTVSFNADANDIVSIKIYNTSGQQVFVQEKLTQDGVNQFILNVSEYKKGMYFLHLENSSQVTINSKIVKTDSFGR